MMLGNVERFEIVVGRFYFRTLDYAETDRGENPLKFLEGLANQMPRTEWALDTGKRKIDFVVRRNGLLRGRLDYPLAFRDNGFDVRFKFVQLLTNGWLQLRRRCLQPVIGDLSEDSCFAAGPSEDEGLQTFSVGTMSYGFSVESLARLGEHLRNDFGSLRAELLKRLRCGVVVVHRRCAWL